MAKKKITWELYSYGIYSRWERTSKALPRLLDITDRIPVQPDIEFGYILKITGAKGKKLDFCIDHPPFNDDKGQLAPPFEGEYYINSNNYEFFLGDTVWEPYEDKEGTWTLSTWMDGKLLAEKKLILYIE